MKWLCPAELPVNGRHGPRGILKLDELNTASPAMMAVCFQIVLERRAGEHRLDAVGYWWRQATACPIEPPCSGCRPP
jgi:hypothetical protein